jgi:hypothetical protein
MSSEVAGPAVVEEDVQQVDPSVVPERFDPSVLREILNDLLKEKQQEYWDTVNKFLRFQLGKLELDSIVGQLLGDHKCSFSLRVFCFVSMLQPKSDLDA